MARSKSYQTFVLPFSTYDTYVYIGRKLLSNRALLKRHVQTSQVFIVTDNVVAPLYLSLVQEVFSEVECNAIVLPEGEEHKNKHHLFAIYDALIMHQYHRESTIVALGGGVIGDIAGVAAASYLRGVRFVQLPTTVLAQADASIGGKAAINHPQAKNSIGCFYQPHAVMMDIDTLYTLPPRVFCAGFAEIIKHALLVGGSFLERVRIALTYDLATMPPLLLMSLITENCKIKSSFIYGDIKDTGRRMLLNLGHTFAHALETCTHYTRWLHGEAVAIGLYCAALLSYHLGHLKMDSLEDIDNLLKAAGLPRRIPFDIDIRQLQCAFLQDKKIMAHQLRFILIRSIGDCYIANHVDEKIIQRTLYEAIE